MFEFILFFILGGVAVVSGLLVVVQKRPVNSALFLIVVFLCMAGLYLLLQAELVAMVQLAVYAGAVMVLFLFVVILLNTGSAAQVWMTRSATLKFAGIAAACVIMPCIGLAISAGITPQAAGSAEAQAGGMKALAALLFTRYLLPFEITSVLLLAAIVGVVYLSQREKERRP